MNRGKKVFVGLSGGVDSSVSAALLKEAGYDVTGVFIKVWSPDFLECTWKEDRRDAMRVCAELGIPFKTLDLEKEYKQGVVDYMVREYRAGRTPNPDVMCNREVKFGAFLAWAKEQGADFIATGHYAQNIFNTETGKYELWAGVDAEKDQSYFLWTLTQEDLKHVLFPIGHLHKSQVRERAEKFGLPTAAKKDSQGLCFLGKLDMRDFLKHFVDEKPGKALDAQGKEVGVHEGAFFYALGQRHGFEAVNGVPQYVIAKNVEKNTITVGPDPLAAQEKNTFTLEQKNWISGNPGAEDIYWGRNRYRQELFQCRIEDETVTFLETISLAPSGQSFVVYEKHGEGLVCRGGGVIS